MRARESSARRLAGALASVAGIGGLFGILGAGTVGLAGRDPVAGFISGLVTGGLVGLVLWLGAAERRWQP